MIKHSFIIVLIIILGVAGFLIGRVLNKETSGYEMARVKIGGKTINVEIADTLEKQLEGLSGRESLAENNGMLFVFNEAKSYTFWMKDMNFSLDIIWINDNEVVDFIENAQPSKEKIPPSFYPQTPADKVLEAPAGSVKKLNIKVGDRITVNN